MAAADPGSAETGELRRELESEREELSRAVDALRGSADLLAPLRARLPLFLAVAAGLGFVLGGGIGATTRLLFRRGREGRTRLRLGPLALVDRSK